MSALGQKPTFAVQKGMSALLPIATAKANFRKRPCLLYPRKRTCAVQLVMSAMGQKRNHAAQQKGSLFDHLLGVDEQSRRHCKAERFGSLDFDRTRRRHRTYWTHLRERDARCWIDRLRPEPFRLASARAS